MLNGPPGGIDSFVFKELCRCSVVYVCGAILYTGAMFLRELIYLIYKISALILCFSRKAPDVQCVGRLANRCSTVT